MSWPKIGNRQQLSKEWAVQSVILPRHSHWSRRKDRVWIKGIQRGYVKIWRNIDGEWFVVDTALNVVNAKRRIKLIKEQERGQSIQRTV